MPVLIAIPAFIIWWFIHVNSQGNIMSLSPESIKAQISASTNVDVTSSDGSRYKIAVDSDEMNKLDTDLWKQFDVDGALSIKADIVFKVKAGSSNCEIRFIKDKNTVIAILNQYYRCYELPENEFRRLYSVFY